MNTEFPTFKARQDLSFHDIAEIFDCSILQARAWSEGDAPKEINRIARIANAVGLRAKKQGMTDADSQYFEKDKENYIKAANKEKEEIIKDKLKAYKVISKLQKSWVERLKFLVSPDRLEY